SNVGPDKIIVYCFFSSAYSLLMGVRILMGWRKCPEVGGMAGIRAPQDPACADQQENESEHGPCVMLLLNVGSVGLNITFANVLIIVDVLWSALSNQQLVGQVWRHPQWKQVHVYQLIGGGSPDVFLNNMSFSKSLIMEMFMNVGDTLR
ncbi:hypothetical protein EI94DRAFT_1471623, partial [Lactarius quietus]